MPWILRGLRDGVVTTGYPKKPDPYAEHGVASLARPVRDATADPSVAQLCPTGAIDTDTAGNVRVDQGRCIGCGDCVRDCPQLFEWQPGCMAGMTRELLVVPEPDGSDERLARLRSDLAARTAAFGRSVHIRHVDAGSDGADEWEVLALGNPVYDVHRLGIFFTASPRHADILLVTGVGARGMAAPLARTLDAMPRPVVVIAAGTDATGGGLVAGTYATLDNGISDVVPVDVWVPGSPPTPFALLHAILLAAGRLTSAPKGGGS